MYVCTSLYHTVQIHLKTSFSLKRGPLDQTELDGVDVNTLIQLGL